MGFSLKELTLYDLATEVAEYILTNDREIEDYEENPSEVHIYRLAEELKERVEDVANFNIGEFSPTEWQQVYIESTARNGELPRLEPITTRVRLPNDVE